jgi:propanol-preferring alcohol dehydrogenase
MSDIPAFPYDILWQEKRLVSVANLTRQDGEEFLKLAPQVPIHVTTESFPLSEVNTALTRLREGKLTGAAVLIPKKGDVSLS